MAALRFLAMMILLLALAAINGCGHVDVVGKWKGTQHGAQADFITHKKSIYFLILKPDGTGYFKDVDMDIVYKLTWTQSMADLNFVLDEQPANKNYTRNKYARIHEDGKTMRLVWEDIRHPAAGTGLPSGALLPEESYDMEFVPKKPDPDN